MHYTPLNTIYPSTKPTKYLIKDAFFSRKCYCFINSCLIKYHHNKKQIKIKYLYT